MIVELWVAVYGGVGTFIGGFAGWFFRRRFENATAKGKEAEARSQEIDNEIKLAEYYKNIADDLEPRYAQKFNEISELYESKIQILYDEIKLLNRKVKMLTQENNQLRRRVKELES